MSKRIIIPWSGGLDSTALLIHAINDNNVNNIHTISFGLENNYEQIKAEKKSRKRIRKQLKKHYKKHYNSYFAKWTEKVYYNIPYINIRNKRNVIIQPLLWSSILPCLIDPDIISSDIEIWMGYIQNDIFWHVKKEFEIIFQNACKLMNINVILKYPLEWYHKEDIIKYYYLDYPDIFKLISSCERGKDWNFCNCEKCEKMKKLSKYLEKHK